MADNIKKMVYPEAEQMVQVLKEAIAQLQNTITDMDGVANALEGGAMLGNAGEKFANAVRSKLVTNINKLVDGLEDGVRYVNMEKEDMQAAEQKSAALF
jgi:uncharacterized protein YukE